MLTSRGTRLVELVETLEETVQGSPVQPEQLETLCSQLLLFSSNTDTSLPVRWWRARHLGVVCRRQASFDCLFISM